MVDIRHTLPSVLAVLLITGLRFSTPAWELAVVKARAVWPVILRSVALTSLGVSRKRHSNQALQVTCSFSFGRGSACIVDCINVAGAPCQGAYTTYGPYGKGAYAALGELCNALLCETLRKINTNLAWQNAAGLPQACQQGVTALAWRCCWSRWRRSTI